MRRSEDGFSMVEVLLVLVVIGVLISIALAQFTGARVRSQDTEAKLSALNSVKVARSVSTDGTWRAATVATMTAAERAYTYVAGGTASTTAKTVSMVVPDLATTANTLILATYSKSSTCFFVRSLSNGLTTYGRLTNVTSANCYANRYTVVTFANKW